MRSYREGGKVKQEVIHLGQYATAEAALAVWPHEVQELRRTRPKQSERLQQKLDRLRELTKGEE